MTDASDEPMFPAPAPLVFTDLRWVDAEKTQIDATIESGEVIRIAAVAGLLHYEQILASGALIASSVPQTISDRQFFQQLAVVGIISMDDALASNAAVIPPPLVAIIDMMPEEQQFAAKMIISGATMFERSHPMTIAIGTAYGWTAEQIDGFFVQAAAL